MKYEEYDKFDKCEKCNKYKDYDNYDSYEEKDDYIDDNFCEEDYMEEYDSERFKPTRKKKIEVEEVVDIGAAETITEVCVPLRPPAFEVVTDLITKEVIFDVLVASKGKVFVNGRIIKDVPYKTKARTTFPDCPNVSKATYGDIRHVTLEIPFALCIDVPKAKKGDKVVVLDWEVTQVDIPNHTNCIPNSCVAKCEPFAKRFDTCFKRPFCSLTEKDCIWVKVKVVKDVIIEVPCREHCKE